MLITRFDMQEINKPKKKISIEFEKKEIGTAKKILGMSITRNKLPIY